MGPGASWDLAELPDNWCCPGFGVWGLEVGSLVETVVGPEFGLGRPHSTTSWTPFVHTSSC